MTPTHPIRHNIMLPQERFFQLQELADALGGATMSETLQKLFQAARDQGLIKDHTIPGVDVEINALSDGVVIQFDKQERVGFTFDAALALADAVRQFAAGTNTTSHLIDGDHFFSVRRKGRGVIVELTTAQNGPAKAWNPDLATEFAELIEAAVATKRPQ